MVARKGKGVKELLGNLLGKVGPLFTKRDDVTLDEAIQENLAKVQENPPDMFAGQPIQSVNRMDGCKFLMADGSWFLFRPSGTEPLVRCYGESSTQEGLQEIMVSGKRLLQTGL